MHDLYNELYTNFNMNLVHKAKAVYLHTNLIVFDLSEGVRPHVTIASELKGSFLIEKTGTFTKRLIFDLPPAKILVCTVTKVITL